MEVNCITLPEATSGTLNFSVIGGQGGGQVEQERASGDGVGSWAMAAYAPSRAHGMGSMGPAR